MKFFISDTKTLKNKYGKWFWYTDNECCHYQNDEHRVIYAGYTIGEDILEIIKRNPHELEHANGTYWAVIMTKQSVKVIVDYFCQTKVFYRNKDAVEIANALYLFPFTSKDVDRDEVEKRLRISNDKKEYTPTENFEKWESMVLDWGYAGSPSLGIRQYSPNMCTTVFKDTYILQPDHCLIADNTIKIARIHNTQQWITESLRTKHNMSAEEIQNKIYECMNEHANLIKKKYKNIVSSLSEGIDSVLQDQYFPDADKIMYDFKPSNAPFEYKQNAIDKTKNRKCKVENFILDKSVIEKTASTVMNDPSCFYWDTLPTQQQVYNLENKPDILMYGQNGDNMFMHKPFFYYEYMFSKQIEKELPVKQKLIEFEKTLKDFQDCYSSVNNIWDKPATTWQEAFSDMTKEQLIQELENDPADAYIDDFARKNTPGLYNREISHAGDVLVTSLFCDKRIFGLVMSAKDDVMLESIKDAKIQKEILRNKFQYEYETPHKDQAEFNAVHIIKPMYVSTIRHCLKNHLPEV
jgi:hypothetical protein